MITNRLFLIWLLLLPVLARAAELGEVQKLLEKMQHAAHTQSYDGTFVYSQGENKLSAMRIIHSANAKGEQERLVSLDSVGREVIRDSKSVICILPDRNAVVVEKGRPPSKFPPPFPDNLERLKGYYSFSIEGEEKVAGQWANKLVVKPNDNFRYGHRLWIDKKTGLLLKTHLVNEQGKLIEQFMFTHIKYMKQVPKNLLKPSIDSSKFVKYESGDINPKPKSKPVGPDVAWEVTKLPPGFKRDYQRRLKMPASRLPSKQLVFSDGLASISVFIESNTDSGNLIGRSHMGAVNAHGKDFNGYHVTAVGEVPHATVKMVSESVIVKKTKP